MASSQKGLLHKPIFHFLVLYLLIVLVVLAALLLRLFLVHLVGELPPFLIFYPTVMLIAIFGGVWPGIFATLLAAIATDYFIIPPRWNYAISSITDTIALTIFTLMGVFVSLIAESYRRSKHKVAELEKQRLQLEGETRFRSLFDNSIDAMLLTMSDGGIIAANAAACRMFAMTEDEIKQGGLERLIDPDDLRHNTILDERKRTGKARAEATFRNKDGSKFLANVQSVELNSLNSHVIIILEDITERKQAEKALKESEKLYRAIGESINYGVWVCQPDGRNIYASESFLKMVGITQEQCSNFGWGEVLHPDDAEGTITAWQECARTGCDWNREHRFRGVDGQWHHVLARGMPVRDECGQITYWAGINLDIDDLKKTQDKLRQSEERLRLAQENADVGIWDWMVESGSLDFTPELNKLYGLPAGTIKTYQDWRDRVHPEDIGRIEARRDEAIAMHEPFNLEFRDRHSSGEYRWISTKGGAIYNEAGKAIRVLGVNIDITERKQAEEQLAETLKKLTLHLENSPLAVIEWGPDFRLAKWNTQAEIIFGWRADEVIGKQLDEFRWVYETDIEKVAKVSAALVDGSQPRSFSANRNYRKDGTVIECEWYSSAIMDQSGALVSIQALVLDVTARTRAEDALRKSEEHLRNQTHELEQIIGIVSHDLRAPLVNVKGFNNFIKQDFQTIKKLLTEVYIPAQIEQQLQPIFEQSIPEATGFIDSSAGSMNTLVKSLVEVARVGLAVTKPEYLDMNEIVPKIASTLEIKFKTAHARICLDNLPSCWADRIQVTQIFTNLIDNAVKYLDPDRPGQICIGGQIDRDHVMYCVADNGIGIAPEDQDKVFEIFTRLVEKAHAGGEGMGLTMVKRMVDRNNGQIWLESEKGKGTSFFVSLPAPTRQSE